MFFVVFLRNERINMIDEQNNIAKYSSKIIYNHFHHEILGFNLLISTSKVFFFPYTTEMPMKKK
jgi:hypothetical protein